MHIIPLIFFLFFSGLFRSITICPKHNLSVFESIRKAESGIEVLKISPREDDDGLVNDIGQETALRGGQAEGHVSSKFLFDIERGLEIIFEKDKISRFKVQVFVVE